MKKIALVLIVFACVSCGKQEVKEWQKFYGYTNADIAGEYTFSGVADAFEDLVESDESHLCADALINVVATSEQTISFQFSSPENGFQKSFTGRTSLNPNAFLVSIYTEMSNLKRYGLSATVMKNMENDIRLEGFVTEDHYERVYDPMDQVYDTVFNYSVKYFFDVIKN